MTKSDFRELFLRALNEAAEIAEAGLARPIPRSFEIELHAPGSAGPSVSVEDALDQIYLGDNCFYRIIDVAIRRLRHGRSVVFVRVSGHTPAAFHKTWDPSHLGPFKQIAPEGIEEPRVGAG